MADKFDLQITGLQDAVTALRGLVPKLRKKAILDALRAGGRVFRDEARRLTPVLAVPVRRRGRVVRKPGTVRRAISVRTSKSARAAGDLGVFVNVRPAKRSARGAYSPDDPYYWQWLEFGRFGQAPARMLQRAASRASSALQLISAGLGRAIQKLNRPKAPAP
jgi:HK97 gp10 family phage protein